MKSMIRSFCFSVPMLLSAFSLWGQTPPPPAASQKPPVLIITLDTTRADRLGCYGNKDGLTRNLDRFAESATLFSNAHSAIPQTVPAHTTIFSGLNPNSHSVRKNLEVRVPQNIPLLAEELQGAGYQTGAFISSFVLLGSFGMNRGFGTYEDSFYRRGYPESAERKAPETIKKALPWILSQKGPWFCWLHLYDPHFPYEPPEAVAKKFPGRPYDGEIAFMDTSLGLLFQKLDEAGILDSAVVVICGDHGEALGEHGEMTHGLFIYDSSMRVPLLLKRPGQQTASRVGRSVGLVDLTPTVRDLCGLPAKTSDGVSLLPLLDGKTLDRAPVYLESLEPLYAYGWAPLYGAVDAQTKFILAPRHELYDLGKDPQERTNLFTKESAPAKRLKGWVQGCIEKTVKAPVGEKLRLDQEELKSLQSLGYIAGTPGSSAGGSYRDPKDMTKALDAAIAAEMALKQGRAEEAARLYEQVVRLDPASPYFHLQLGTALQEIRPAEAEVHYKKVLQLRPSFPQVYSRLMVLWFNHNRSAEAYQLGKLGLSQVDDFDGEIHALTGYAALKAGRPEAEILGYLDEASKRGKEFPVALKARAVLAIQRGDKAASLAYIEKMAEDAPTPYLIQLETDERFAALRGESRFWAVILSAKKKMGMK